MLLHWGDYVRRQNKKHRSRHLISLDFLPLLAKKCRLQRQSRESTVERHRGKWSPTTLDLSDGKKGTSTLLLLPLEFPFSRSFLEPFCDHILQPDVEFTSRRVQGRPPQSTTTANIHTRFHSNAFPQVCAVKLGLHNCELSTWLANHLTFFTVSAYFPSFVQVSSEAVRKRKYAISTEGSAKTRRPASCIHLGKYYLLQQDTLCEECASCNIFSSKNLLVWKDAPYPLPASLRLPSMRCCQRQQVGPDLLASLFVCSVCLESSFFVSFRLMFNKTPSQSKWKLPGGITRLPQRLGETFVHEFK